MNPHPDPTSVLDANRERIGRVIGSELSDGTREPTSLLIQLDPELDTGLDPEHRAMWLPFENVRSIRRGEMELDEAIHDLLEAEEAGFTIRPAPQLDPDPD